MAPLSKKQQEQLTKPYEPVPAGDPRFHEIVDGLKALHDRKEADYGRQGDPLANIRASSDWGFEPWIGCMMRATDKLRRLQKFAREGKLANESVIDSFRDMAVYCILGEILYREQHGDTMGPAKDEV